jgi:hypothetical protein
MPNCPYCDVLIDEAYNFCVSCEQQVKCLVCGSYLIKDKSKCLKCGNSLSVSQTIATPMNNFSLEEEQTESNYSRKLNLSFTDTAIDKVAAALGGYVPFNLPKSPKPMAHPQQIALPFSSASTDNDHFSQSEKLSEEPIETTSENILDKNSPSSYFERDEQGFLVSVTPDYKGKNKKLQQQRFSLLYVWAYNSICGEVVPGKTHLNQAAKINGVYDKNYSKHLTDVANRFFIKSDGTFKLNPGGRSEVNKILIEMQDADLSGLEYWNSTRKNSNRGSRITKEDTQKIEQWLQLSSRFEHFDVRTLGTTYKYALLALYDITKELKAQEAVKPGTAYEYLVKRYKTISVSKENFSKVLTNTRDYGKYFSRTSEGLYYLSPEAENLVGGWLNQNNGQSC